MLSPLLRRSILLFVFGAIVAAVREAMLRHHERDFGPPNRHEP